MKYFIQILIYLVITVLTLGILTPMLISAKDTLQVVFGFTMVIVWTIFSVYLGKYYFLKILGNKTNPQQKEE